MTVSESEKPRMITRNGHMISKYLKMFKVKVPEEAVKQRMVLEQVPPEVVAAVLSSFSSQEYPLTVPELEKGAETKELSMIEKYNMMKKVLVPEAAVRQLMKVEGASCEVYNAVFPHSSDAIPSL
mmetsp:Transcript_44828/g.54250  ORF Transcript_44828/g.54250 Transcript_44828/m.54250 type:complete len:125 (+) Transcript_44828:163-537(+)|eukprot:CAMPEP_0172507634 /NCGR_PEP_ID=MMETSP1066-20121228/205244_1 /TAXON_ID=671091 /ORGANISM="Coscinodiscus wailesii, Strain CCMP2513" /LENGTH=124 /DNA_ID=CAMNT_0013285249 /DNA_START=154 /DNA_END=528 /DNA_ORIENTATION=-